VQSITDQSKRRLPAKAEEEIARVLELKESRVCQIYTQAVNRLRVFLLARLN
jgi:DNA-directed RNA polymerase specialized sigma subunit